MHIDIYTKKIRSMFRKHHGERALSVYKDWKQLVVSFALINLMILGVSTYLFLKISRGEIFLSEKIDDVQVRTIDREKLKDTLEYYQKKQKKLEELRGVKIVPVKATSTPR